MTDREKKELIEAEETILQLFFDTSEMSLAAVTHCRQRQAATRPTRLSRPPGRNGARNRTAM